MTTNTTEMEKDWNVEKEELRKRFISLTDHNMEPGEGKNEEILEKLKAHLGISEDELNNLLLGL